MKNSLVTLKNSNVTYLQQGFTLKEYKMSILGSEKKKKEAN